jgi:hypothetical protein
VDYSLAAKLVSHSEAVHLTYGRTIGTKKEYIAKMNQLLDVIGQHGLPMARRPQGVAYAVSAGIDKDQTIKVAPEAVGIPGAEIAGAGAGIYREDDRPAGCINDGLHCDLEPLDSGLGIVLQAELRADFGRTEFKAELVCTGANFLVCGKPLEAEIGN